jgi:hypothetical protein
MATKFVPWFDSSIENKEWVVRMKDDIVVDHLTYTGIWRSVIHAVNRQDIRSIRYIGTHRLLFDMFLLVLLTEPSLEHFVKESSTCIHCTSDLSDNLSAIIYEQQRPSVQEGWRYLVLTTDTSRIILRCVPHERIAEIGHDNEVCLIAGQGKERTRAFLESTKGVYFMAFREFISKHPDADYRQIFMYQLGERCLHLVFLMAYIALGKHSYLHCRIPARYFACVQHGPWREMHIEFSDGSRESVAFRHSDVLEEVTISVGDIDESTTGNRTIQLYNSLFDSIPVALKSLKKLTVVYSVCQFEWIPEHQYEILKSLLRHIRTDWQFVPHITLTFDTGDTFWYKYVTDTSLMDEMKSLICGLRDMYTDEMNNNQGPCRFVKLDAGDATFLSYGEMLTFVLGISNKPKNEQIRAIVNLTYPMYYMTYFRPSEIVKDELGRETPYRAMKSGYRFEVMDNFDSSFLDSIDIDHYPIIFKRKAYEELLKFIMEADAGARNMESHRVNMERLLTEDNSVPYSVSLLYQLLFTLWDLLGTRPVGFPNYDDLEECMRYGLIHDTIPDSFVSEASKLCDAYQEYVQLYKLKTVSGDRSKQTVPELASLDKAMRIFFEHDQLQRYLQ